MDLAKDILELLGAAYSILSIIGHLPFIPPKVAAFCNKLALNLKGASDEK